MAKKLDKVEVVTVGVGWTGGIIAAELAKAGYQVLGLERGKETSLDDYNQIKDELKYNPRNEMMNDLSDATLTFRNNFDTEALPIRDNGNLRIGKDTGGGGSHWAAQYHRYFPYDYEIYSKTVERYGKDKIPEGMTIQDWGITYDEIEPYYDKFEKMAGISGEEDPFGPQRSNPYPTPPMKDVPITKMFKKAAKNLGYHPLTLASATLSESYENPDGQRINACQYCAFCYSHGCQFGAKSDPIITVIPTAQETNNFELRTNANVTRILYEDGKAKGVLYTDTRTGEEFEQPADVVVMTSYTFNNVRLLLLSEIGTPYNPKTGEGVIGKNFCDHHVADGASNAVGFFNEKKFNLYMGAGGLGAIFYDLAADNFDHSDVDFIHGGVARITQGGSGAISHNPVPKGTPTWGREFKEKSLFYANRMLNVNFMFAVMPYRDNYLDLDPNYTDRSGDPLIRVTFDFKDQEHNLLKYGRDVCADVMKEMGADIIEPSEDVDHISGSFIFQHSSGGAIMGSSPETSAVNNYSQMWDVDNLFVVGASAFPHFSSANPTGTVGAMAYRAAEGIEEFLKNGGGQLVEAKDAKAST
uniref:GMC family oxidoreductase n=1 Tax=uncultured Allobacillus sp. TaxID=1638025 RepID=UPI00259A6465|nr:GMC family oxidoreductase [uncultured Allobacillus sp.]